MESLYGMFAAFTVIALCASLSLTQENPGGKKAAGHIHEEGCNQRRCGFGQAVTTFVG